MSARRQAQVGRVASVPPHTIVNQIAHQPERRERGVGVDALCRKHKHTVRPGKNAVPGQQVEKVIVNQLHRVERGGGDECARTLARCSAVRQQCQHRRPAAAQLRRTRAQHGPVEQRERVHTNVVKLGPTPKLDQRVQHAPLHAERFGGRGRGSSGGRVRREHNITARCTGRRW